jgi:two-component system response regulator RegA
MRNVLVVDDDEMILTAFRRSGRGCRVLTATDRASARHVVETEQVDLVVVDLRLGSSSGLDLVHELKASHPELVVALCSAYLSVAVAVAAVRAGADDVFFKPITFSEILRRIDEGGGETLTAEDTPSLAKVEYEHISRVLADCHGNVSMAARRLGIFRSSLQRKMRKHAPRH